MKLCECGCGQPAPLSSQTRTARGQVKGQPVRFINGHNRHQHTDECKRRIAAAGKGRRHSDETRQLLSEIRRGPSNPAWKGGTHERRQRRLIYVGKSHPMANRSGYVAEHRLTMAGVIGRPLRRDEHVHHLDLNSLNNHPTNLIVVSPSQHSRIHRLIDWHGIPALDAVTLILNDTRAPA